MAICDLSSLNPNVLFELGIRQSFDKPVALIQEEGTPKIFDISPFRYTYYRKERIYHEVLEDQRKIAEAILDTYKAHSDGTSVHSLIKLLSITQAASVNVYKNLYTKNVGYTHIFFRYTLKNMILYPSIYLYKQIPVLIYLNH